MSSHCRLPLTRHLTLHALLRSGSNDPCFSIREIDMKLLRSGGSSPSKRTKSVPGSSTAQLNEQAARVKARQLMLSYATQLIEATKDEIRWLKDCGVLGKRAPKSSLMSATFLHSLLQEQDKSTLAAHLQNALVNAKIGKWKNVAKVELSEEDAALDDEYEGMYEEAAGGATAGDEDEEHDASLHDATPMDDDHSKNGHTDVSESHEPPVSHLESRPRRRSTAAKRKSGTPSKNEHEAQDHDGDTHEGVSPPTTRKKRTKRTSASDHSSNYSSPHLSSAHLTSSSAHVTPLFLAPIPKPPPNMAISKAVLMLNPLDRSTGLSSAPNIHFGADRTALLETTTSDGCTIAGPYRGSASARASHGITSGSWYIEVKGTEAAAAAMRLVAKRAASLATDDSASSLLEQDAPPHCRIGFATDQSQLEPKLLGHDEYSYAYGDRYGDKIHEGEACEYGAPFSIFQMDQHEIQSTPLKPGDTIGMLIELGVSTTGTTSISRSSSSGAPSPTNGASPSALNTGNRISFYKNGECQGIAWSDLQPGRTWYPAVSLINGMACTFDFQVNLAQAKPTHTRLPTQYPDYPQHQQQSHHHQAHHQHNGSNGSSYGLSPYQSPSDYPQQHSRHHLSSHLPHQSQSHSRSNSLSSSQPWNSTYEHANGSSVNSSRMADLQRLRMDVQHHQQSLADQHHSQHSHSSLSNHSAGASSTSHAPTGAHRSNGSSLFADSSPRITGIYQSSSASNDMSDDFRQSSLPLPSQPSVAPASSSTNYSNSMPPSSRHLRVPPSEDDHHHHHHHHHHSMSSSSVPPSILGNSGLLHPSPSPSPAFSSLISPAPSPTPLVNTAHLLGSGTNSYSLSTTPLPMMDTADAGRLLYANSPAVSPPPEIM